MIWERTREVQRLRQELLRYFPAALEAFDDLSAPDTLELLSKVPDRARKLTRVQVSAALKRAGRRDITGRATVILTALRSEQLIRSPVLAAAHAATARSLAAVITILNEQVKTLEVQVREHFGQLPDAEIVTSQPGMGMILGAREFAEFGEDPAHYRDGKVGRNYVATSPVTRASGKRKVAAAQVRAQRPARRRPQSPGILRPQRLTRRPSVTTTSSADGHNDALRRLANRLVGTPHGCLKTRTPSTTRTPPGLTGTSKLLDTLSPGMSNPGYLQNRRAPYRRVHAAECRSLQVSSPEAARSVMSPRCGGHTYQREEPSLMDSHLPVISLFSGAGGLDMAVEKCTDEPGSLLQPRNDKALLSVRVATDYDALALETLAKNMPDTPTICADIRLTGTSMLLEAGGLNAGEVVLVIGGPPCTPFSKSGFWLEEKRTSSDPNASLLDEYVRVVREARPEAFVLENVQGLTYRTHAAQFERLLTDLRSLGYNPQWKVLMAADYGIPQLRRRVFVVGRRDGKKFLFPPSTHSGWSERDRVIDPSKLPYVTTSQVLSDLLPGEPEKEEIVEGEFADLAAEVPPGQNYLWHTKRYGGRDVFKWRSRYWTFLLRLDPERPSTTLQAQPGPWVGPFHWENVHNADLKLRARRLRVPEMLRIMTFPDDFITVGSRADFQRQIGNAVPVELGKVIIRALMQQLGYLHSDQTQDEELQGQTALFD